MNLLIALATLAGMFSNTGCRSARDNQIDILESELRTQEDYIYELEDYIVEYSEKLREYRCAQMETVIISKNASEPELAMPPRSRTDASAPTTKELLKALDEPAETITPDVTEPETTEEILEESLENLEAPELELEIGEPLSAIDEYENATPLAEAEIEGTLLADGSFIPDPSVYQTVAIEEAEFAEEAALSEEELEVPVVEEEAAGQIEEYVEPFDDEITPTGHRDPERLVISHVYRNSSEAEAPVSLLSVVEARDASNEPADFNGKVSLMVMQIDNEKPPQRVKRWDFTAEETSAAWQSSNLGDGLHLELPLAEDELPQGALELWVRLETTDGRKLLAQIPFERATLVSINEAEGHLAEVDHEVDGATHLATANPLRKEKPEIKTSPLRTADAKSKSEPQWRAATHESSGTNSGFATTATGQKWSSRPIGSKSARETANLPAAQSSEQQWRARK